MGTSDGGGADSTGICVPGRIDVDLDNDPGLCYTAFNVK